MIIPKKVEYYVYFFLICLLAFFCGFMLTGKKVQQVIVNMPADAQPLAQLDKTIVAEVKVISEERAVLWWTVYKYTLERTGDGPYGASLRASEAVKSAYGERSHE